MANVLVRHSSRAEMWNRRWSLDVDGHRGLGDKLHWSKASIVRDWGGKVKKTELKDDVLNE